VSNNGTQLASQQLGKLCSELGIKQVFASVEHPQMNGQTESTKKVLLRGLKRILEKEKGTWSEEIPKILWSYHHPAIDNQRDTFQFGIWVRCHNTSGDTREFP